MIIFSIILIFNFPIAYAIIFSIIHYFPFVDE